jgi:hypothetical protein
MLEGLLGGLVEDGLLAGASAAIIRAARPARSEASLAPEGHRAGSEKAADEPLHA